MELWPGSIIFRKFGSKNFLLQELRRRSLSRGNTQRKWNSQRKEPSSRAVQSQVKHTLKFLPSTKSSISKQHLRNYKRLFFSRVENGKDFSCPGCGVTTEAENSMTLDIGFTGGSDRQECPICKDCHTDFWASSGMAPFNTALRLLLLLLPRRSLLLLPEPLRGHHIDCRLWLGLTVEQV